jgi:hypothetical protein
MSLESREMDDIKFYSSRGKYDDYSIERNLSKYISGEEDSIKMKIGDMVVRFYNLTYAVSMDIELEMYRGSDYGEKKFTMTEYLDKLSVIKVMEQIIKDIQEEEKEEEEEQESKNY